MNPTLNATGISSINVDRLKQEMTRRGLPTHGLTPILAERLQQAIGNPLLAQQLAGTTMIPEMYDMLAAGDVESIRLWLDAGVDVDIADEDGMTPLTGTCQLDGSHGSGEAAARRREQTVKVNNDGAIEHR